MTSVSDKVIADTLARTLEKARREQADSLEKLSTGQVFTSLDPRPSERAVAEGLGNRLRSLAASKRNINDAVSLLQTAESSFTTIGDIITRMKEIHVAATNSVMSDREREFYFIEYEALHTEVNRIAATTEFNGMPLLNGKSERVPETVIFRLDDPFRPEDSSNLPDAVDPNDLNIIVFKGIKDIVATTEGLGLKSAAELLANAAAGDGFDPEDLADLMLPEDEDKYTTVYDQAFDTLASFRSTYGAMQSRLDRSLDFLEVYQENLSAAKSKIADTDYAREVAHMAQNQIVMQATTGLLAQNNAASSLTLNLISSLLK